ncbi:hypothetical protein Tco_0675763 [Tanacetum coccineum]
MILSLNPFIEIPSGESKVQRIENGAKTVIFRLDSIKFTYYSRSRRSCEISPSMPMEKAQEIKWDCAFTSYWDGPTPFIWHEIKLVMNGFDLLEYDSGFILVDVSIELKKYYSVGLMLELMELGILEQCLSDHYTAPVTPPPLAYTPTPPVLATMEPLDTFLMGDEESELTLDSTDLECSMPINPPLPCTDVLGDAIVDIDLLLGEHLDTLSTLDMELTSNLVGDIEET